MKPQEPHHRERASCALEVYSTLGPGLLESVYEEALAQEFALRKISNIRQKEISLR